MVTQNKSSGKATKGYEGPISEPFEESSGEADASASERCASAGLSQCVPGRAASS